MNAAWGVGLHAIRSNVGESRCEYLARYSKAILECGAEIWPIWTMAKDDKWKAAEKLQRKMGKLADTTLWG